MKKKEVFELKEDEKINHKNYGICTVKNVIPDFGIVILPDTREGRSLLSWQSGMPEEIPLLETSYRLILSKVSKE